jgi:CO/xanthine dehydrogenase FAD-binding subunit
MIPKPFDYIAPGTLAEVIRLLDTNSDSRALAGGQGLLNEMKLRFVSPTLLVDLNNVPDLQHCTSLNDSGFHLGAMCTFSRIMEDPVLKATYPALLDAVSALPGVPVRNRSTLGGSLAQNTVGADLPAAMLALDASINMQDAYTSRSVSAVTWYEEKIPLTHGAVITSIDLPAVAPGETSAYVRVRNPANGTAICGVAVRLSLAADLLVQDCRVAATGITEYPLRLSLVEDRLRNNVLTPDLLAAIPWSDFKQPLISDHVASDLYRTHLLTVLTERAINHASARFHI